VEVKMVKSGIAVDDELDHALLAGRDFLRRLPGQSTTEKIRVIPSDLTLRMPPFNLTRTADSTGIQS
jgi:hypothetical protein